MAKVILLRRIKTDDDKPVEKGKGEIKQFYQVDHRSAIRNGRWEIAYPVVPAKVEEEQSDGGEPFELTELLNSDKDVLKKICKYNKIKVSGNIKELAERIISANIKKG